MTSTPGAVAFCHPVDVVDDLPGTLDTVAGLAVPGCRRPTGLALASAYHCLRDYLPRNRRRVHYSPAGLAFEPDASLYPEGLAPAPALRVCGGRDVLQEAVVAGAERGMAVDAWAVYLHHDARSASGETEGRVVNAFGDVYPVALCPASPLVADYAEALTRDVVARRPASIIAEGLHPQPFAHGFHHERMFGRHGGLRRFLLGLCFCDACGTAAGQAGVDIQDVRAWARRTIDSPDGDRSLPGWESLERLAATHVSPGSLATYLDLRAHSTTALVRRCVSVAEAAGVGFRWLDATHAWADQDSEPAASAETAWQIGCDLREIGGASSVVTACYGSADAWVSDLERSACGLGRMPDGVVLRALCTDETDASELLGRIKESVRRGADWIGLYHFGLAPMPFAEVLGAGS